MAVWALFPGHFSAGLERSGAPERKIAKGRFLIADPRLTDPNFRESVVLIVRHGSDGTIGIIINRPTAAPLSSLRDLPLPGTAPDLLFFGGPVSPGRISSLIQTGHPVLESAVLEEVYFTFDPGEIPGLLKESKRFRIYAGYAGWAPGQLEGELDRGDWRLLPGEAALLFEKDPGRIWPELWRRAQQRSVGRPGLPGPAVPLFEPILFSTADRFGDHAEMAGGPAPQDVDE